MNRGMISLKSLNQNNRFLGNGGSSNIRLLLSLMIHLYETNFNLVIRNGS